VVRRPILAWSDSARDGKRLCLNRWDRRPAPFLAATPPLAVADLGGHTRAAGAGRANADASSRRPSPSVESLRVRGIDPQTGLSNGLACSYSRGTRSEVPRTVGAQFRIGFR